MMNKPATFMLNGPKFSTFYTLNFIIINARGKILWTFTYVFITI
jgi:hypothetical protein